MAPAFTIEAHGITDIGPRERNEDRVGCYPELGLFLVVDGMGGQGSGEVASQIALDAVRGLFEETASPSEAPLPFPADASKSYQENRLIAAAQLANRRFDELHKRHGGALRGMASTVAAASVLDGRAQIAHVGDSRVYLLRGGALELLTRDHTLRNDYLQLDVELTPEQLAMLPDNIITRAIGMQDTVVVDSRSLPLFDGDMLLLTTDGIHRHVPDPQIAALLLEHPAPAASAERLIAAALRNGADDNATCVVVRVTER